MLQQVSRDIHDIHGVTGLPNYIGDEESADWAWGDCDNGNFIHFFLIFQTGYHSLHKLNNKDMDLFASGTTMGLYRNNGAGGFATVSSSGINTTATTLGADWGDIDNDGGFFIT